MSIGSIPGIGSSGIQGPNPLAQPASEPGGGFGELLGSLTAIEGDASNAITDLAIDGGRDLSDVVLATELESLSFELAVQMRNRLVDAYQEIFRMSV